VCVYDCVVQIAVQRGGKQGAERGTGVHPGEKQVRARKKCLFTGHSQAKHT
jgi:hypothetical protein